MPETQKQPITELSLDHFNASVEKLQTYVRHTFLDDPALEQTCMNSSRIFCMDVPEFYLCRRKHGLLMFGMNLNYKHVLMKS